MRCSGLTMKCKLSKKVLMITPVFDSKNPKGKSEKMLTHVTEFLRNGWSPIVLVPRKRNEKRYEKISIHGADIKIFRFDLIFSNLFEKGEKKRKGNLTKILNVLKYSPMLGSIKAILLSLSISKQAIDFGAQIALNENVDVIYASNMPINMFIYGAEIKKKTGKPLIVEYREAWTENKVFSTSVDYWLERRVLDSADIVCTYKGVQVSYDHFRHKHNLDKDKFFQLPYMGFHPDHFCNIRPEKNSKYILAYGGSLPGNRLPKSLLLGVKLFLISNDLSPSDFGLMFVGQWSDLHQKMVNKYGLKEFVEPKGFLSHPDYLMEMNKSSAFLLLVNVPGKKSNLCVPTKTWEYISLKKPILLLGKPDWEAAQFLIANKIGVVADLESPVSIKAGLEKLYRDHLKQRSEYVASRKLINSLDRRKTLRHFCNLMNKLVQSRS